ncbi:hypothetical protein GCM10011340_22930 [Roseivirga thermotolerans]|uniref:Uncharacterized protein n=1 Tax=Roseivirga thermotolerans TaxID=1758176 RepID=A0ABQ3I5S9_9BACT|nr:hypothetical protein GCM10011340_22930 [Roseivirga thermotolerans]
MTFNLNVTLEQIITQSIYVSGNINRADGIFSDRNQAQHLTKRISSVTWLRHT